MKLYASTFRQDLEKRFLHASNFLSENSVAYVNKYIVELGQTEDVIMAYNIVVSIYLNPRHTQETQAYIRRLFIAIENMVRNIQKILQDILARAKVPKKQEHLKIVIYAFTLYKDYIRTNG